MSSSIRLTKQKYSQHDLRRLMQEQKAKSSGKQTETKKKIESPLAKYPFKSVFFVTDYLIVP